jgi:hypothetical protein
MDEQIIRIKQEIAGRGLVTNPPIDREEVARFERQHHIVLPEGYRRFLIEIGNGGDGPPLYGLVRLGEGKSSALKRKREFWVSLPLVTREFPFTRVTLFHPPERDLEGTEEERNYGSVYLGTDGCSMDWHLIITGRERGSVWQFGDVGLAPVRRDFLRWYQDWLDGVTDWFDVE